VQTTIYLVRHAQSHLTSTEHYSRWPLSPRGREQAAALAPLLATLQIEKVYSSAYIRCLDTIRPFAERNRLDLLLGQGLEERVIAKGLLSNFEEVWRRSWNDFDFALPDCESSAAAQHRFCEAVREIVHQNPRSILVVSSHGSVIALFLNSIDKLFSLEQADRLRNPDVIKIIATENGFDWDRDFRLSGLDEITTPYHATPIDFTDKAAASGTARRD
jgi:2,3-bisphosphoglycerate-dependent phosphoglycerate mutase